MVTMEKSPPSPKAGSHGRKEHPLRTGTEKLEKIVERPEERSSEALRAPLWEQM